MKPILVDLFCGAGGAAEGYAQAGFEVVGVDMYPQPNFRHAFIQDDAFRFLEGILAGNIFSIRKTDRDSGEVTEFELSLKTIAAIHASPPCQAHSWSARRWQKSRNYQDLILPTRRFLLASRKPYILENVPGAPLIPEKLTVITGPQVGLSPRSEGAKFVPGVIRRRHFETNFKVPALPKVPRKGKVTEGKYVTVAGHGGNGIARVDVWRKAMGVEWMTNRKNDTGSKEKPGNREDIAESIPPAYTRYLGLTLLALLNQLDSDIQIQAE